MIIADFIKNKNNKIVSLCMSNNQNRNYFYFQKYDRFLDKKYNAFKEAIKNQNILVIENQEDIEYININYILYILYNNFFYNSIEELINFLELKNVLNISSKDKLILNQINKLKKIKNTNSINDYIVPLPLHQSFLQTRMNILESAYQFISQDVRCKDAINYVSNIKTIYDVVDSLNKSILYFDKQKINSLPKDDNQDKFIDKIVKNNFKLKQKYNLYRIKTGRLSSNVSNLPKQLKKCFTSKFSKNGALFEFDIISMDMYVIFNIIDYELKRTDIYSQIQKSLNLNLNRDEIKNFVYQNIYSNSNIEFDLFSKINEFKNNLYSEYMSNDYIKTMYNRPVFKDNDINDKSKLFSHYIQTTSNDIIFDIMMKVHDYFKNNKLKSYFYMYNIDGFIIDFKNSELMHINNIINIIEKQSLIKLNCKVDKIE
jgi:hypothetical protein